MKRVINVIVLIFATFICTGQYNWKHNKTWAFGYKAGLDFTSGSPVPIATGGDTIVSSEGVASVCDTGGHLLFYSYGTRVYNKNHVVMPNGNFIAPFFTFSTTQAAVIAPVIGSASKYYLFSLQQATIGDTAMCRLVYCIVDMSLDGGKGDVVPSTLRTFIADSLSEKMIAITGNNKNIWLVTHKLDTPLFLAYEITNTGINLNPVLSACGTFKGEWGYTIGEIKASHDRRKIVSNTVSQFIPFGTQKYGTEIYDFNPANGKLSNCIVLDSINSHYGAEFSPDNSKLYTDQRVSSDTLKIVQYDLSLSTPDLIRASKTQIAIIPKINLAPLKLGPDGKIYFISTDTFTSPYSRFMDCITSPNSAAPACGYVYRAITMVPGTGVQFGLPNRYVTEDTVEPVIVAVTDPQNSVAIFPNPAIGDVTISSQFPISDIKMSDMLGRTVLLKKCQMKKTESVDLSSLSAGLYFISINSEVIVKFQKE
ncbi:MAG: T9SS type A sorting domain-containing protein [Flavipsychrobacter sp.]|nr:T9SS type A sorting domain-containing protein [Flavipsychrobacter sp.]